MYASPVFYPINCARDERTSGWLALNPMTGRHHRPPLVAARHAATRAHVVGVERCDGRRPARRGLAVFRQRRAPFRGHDLMADAATIEVDGLSQALPHRPAPERVRDAARLARARRPPPASAGSTGSRTRRSGRSRTSPSRSNQGEVLGIIGRNGAGKSTLLKLLTRITTPTTGQAVIRGRVGSLLEVGTGFHPELTGRENIYLNGAILGMGRREITQKLPEIVDFAGVGDVPRHAREALLERHVRATRVLGGRAPRAGDPARGRGALRRRRRVPEALPRPHGGVQPLRAHRDLRLPPDARRRAALRPRDPARRWADRARRPERRGGRPVSAVGAAGRRRGASGPISKKRPVASTLGCAR